MSGSLESLELFLRRLTSLGAYTDVIAGTIVAPHMLDSPPALQSHDCHVLVRLDIPDDLE